jgi:hypothetical protein
VADYSEIAKFYDAISIIRPINIQAEFLQSLIETCADINAIEHLELIASTPLPGRALGENYMITTRR